MGWEEEDEDEEDGRGAGRHYAPLRQKGWNHSTVTLTYTVTERMNFVLPQGLSIQRGNV